MKYFITAFFVIFFFSLYAQMSGFTLENGDENEIRISLLRTSGISTAELYRVTGSGDPVIIYEFMQQGEVFVEKADPGTCYFLKIYSENGSAATTEKQCYSGEKYIGRINNNILVLILILIMSVVIPFFIKGRFIDNRDSDYTGIIRQVVLMMDEGGGNLSVCSHQEGRHSMLFYAAYFLASDIQKLRRGKNNGDYLCTSGERNGFAIKVADGYTACDSNGIYKHDRKTVCFSSTVSGIGMDSVNGKKCIVSIEPFLAGAISVENKKGLKPSGAYVFLLAVSVIIVVLSILRTLGLPGGER